MSFKPQYTESAFLNALSPKQLRSTSAIVDTLGCSRSTAKNTLMRLAAEGKIKRIPVVGTSIYGWLRDATVETEHFYVQNGI
jgi:DNA-binding GntR family transcriptional regulator